MIRDNRRFIAILLANFFFFLNFSSLMVLPRYFVELGATPSMIGSLMAVFSLTVLLSLPLVGYLADRLSRKYLFWAGSLLMVFSTAAFAFYEALALSMYVWRILEGLAFACAFGVSGAMVYDIAPPDRRQRLLSILTVSNISTHALGPILAEYLLVNHGSLHCFMTAAILGLIGFLISLDMPDHRAASGGVMRPDRQSLPVVGGALLLGLIFGALIVFVPPMMLELGMMHTKLFFSFFVLGSLLLWPLLKHVIGTRFWFAAVVLLLILPLSISWVDGYRELLPLALLFGFGYGYIYPVLNMRMIDIYPTAHGSANALFVWVFNLGMLLASLIMGQLIMLWGYKLSFLALGSLGLLLLLGF